jgi:hypothetical protein
MHWSAPGAQALLIFIPGGDGYLGFEPGQTDLAPHRRIALYRALARLPEGFAATQGLPASPGVDLVMMDSPGPISPGQIFPSARASADHLLRIEQLVRFYRQKTGLPVWLMGHSNGGISLSAFVKYLQSRGTPDLIAGIVASAVREGTDFEGPLSLPILFVHHRDDGCSVTNPTNSRALFEKVRTFDAAPVTYEEIVGGSAEPRNACYSGYHMYFGSAEQAVRAIAQFIARAAGNELGRAEMPSQAGEQNR